MTLLSEIIDGIDDLAMPALLRKAKILASRVNSDDLRAWANRELNGYRNLDDLPEYRGPFSAAVRGHFVSLYGTAKLPLAAVDFVVGEEARPLFEVNFLQPIAEIVAVTVGQEDPSIPWPPVAIDFMRRLMKEGKVRQFSGAELVLADRLVTRAQMQGVVDTVRTRLLDLALAFEALDPEVGNPGIDPPPAGQVTEVVINNIYSSTVNIAQSSQDVTQNALVVPAPGASLPAVHRR